MRNVIRYWPRLLGCALLLLLSGSLGRPLAHGRHDAKQAKQGVALQQRVVALPQGSLKLTYRTTGLLPSDPLVFHTAARVRTTGGADAAPRLLRSQEVWRADAPRPPPVPA